MVDLHDLIVSSKTFLSLSFPSVWLEIIIGNRLKRYNIM